MQYHKLYNITICTTSLVQHHHLHNITICTVSPLVQHHLYNITTCTTSPLAQHHNLYNITICTISPLAHHNHLHNITISTTSQLAQHHNLHNITSDLVHNNSSTTLFSCTTGTITIPHYNTVLLRVVHVLKLLVVYLQKIFVCIQKMFTNRIIYLKYVHTLFQCWSVHTLVRDFSDFLL